MSSSRRLVLTSLLLASGLGCATARNYEDPASPVYKGGVADRRDAGATLRVVTFNLKWGKEIDRAVELLSRPGPLRGADLVVLEEMDREGTERLGRALGLAYVYVPSAVHPVPNHDFGVALLSPWPLEAPRKLLLPHQNRMRKPRRDIVFVSLAGPACNFVLMAIAAVVTRWLLHSGRRFGLNDGRSLRLSCGRATKEVVDLLIGGTDDRDWFFDRNNRIHGRQYLA
jgi:hypothetical protein